MDAVKIEQLNQILEGAPSTCWNEVIEYARYLIYKSDKSGDVFNTYTEEDMVKRVSKSEEDIEAGRTTKMIDFKQEIDEWKTERRATKS